MNAHFFRSLSILTLTAICLWLTPSTASAAFITTISAVGVQTSAVAGVTTENFNGFSLGTTTTLSTAVGTVTSTGLAILTADVYGGASNPGVRRYFSIGEQSGTAPGLATLTLNSAASYFGLWISAVNNENAMEFYSGATLVGTFNGNNPLITSAYADGTNDNSSGDRFAYVNFTGMGGTTFDRIVFKNSNTPNTQSGFESDNWSVLSAPTNAVPEPTTMTLGLIGTLMGAGIARLRRKSIVA